MPLPTSSALRKPRMEMMMGQPKLDDLIRSLELELSQGVHELSSLVKSKYLDGVPHALDSSISFSLNQLLTKANSQIDSLAETVSALESSVGDLKDTSLTKIAALNVVIQKLTVFSEVEQMFKDIMFSNVQDAGKYASGMVEIGEKIGLMAKEVDQPTLTTLLQGVSTEYQVRLGDFSMFLQNSFRSTFAFSDENEVVTLKISSSDAVQFNDHIVAMRLLNIWDTELNKLANTILENFCATIVNAAHPEKVFTVTKFHDKYHFSTKKNFTKAGAGFNDEVFKQLIVLFEALEESTAMFRLNDESIAQMLGSVINKGFMDMIIKDCLTPAVPYEQDKVEEYQLVLNHANQLHNKMLELKFFTPNSPTFEIFAEKFHDIFITRRCTEIIRQAREFVMDKSVDVVDVGSSDDIDNDMIEDFAKQFNVKVSIQALKNGQPKLLQFCKCKVSKGVFELGQLLEKTFDSAAEAESEVAAGRLLTTAHNIVKLFLTLSQRQNHEAINSIPTFGALFYNNCYYLCHLLMIFSLQISARISKKFPALSLDSTMVSHISVLRQQAASVMETHLLHVRRQISTIIGADDVFVDLNNTSNKDQCRKIFEGCLMQIQQVASIWREILTETVYLRAIGTVINHTLSVFSNVLLAKEDIAEADSVFVAQELTSLLEKFEKLMTAEGDRAIQIFCEREYYKIKEIVNCYNGSLMTIADRWCEGKGPLAHWLSSEQVKRLIRALFQNTDRRAAVLARIN